MPIKNLGDLLALLQNVEPGAAGHYTARCPAPSHGKGQGDNRNSLSITIDGQNILLKCHAGCDNKDIVAALGLTMKDLFLNKEKKSTPGKAGGTICKTYEYQNPDGSLLFEVVRYIPKNFKQRRPDGSGGYIWSIKDITPVLYHLPELIQGVRDERPVFVCEGEKDADALRGWNIIATTSPMGAGKWRDYYSDYLTGANVIVIPDNDEAGRKHANQICHSLYGKANSIRILELSGNGVKDVSDWIDKASGTRDKLQALIRELAEWEPTDYVRQLPTINISDLRLRDQTRSAIDALVLANDPPSLFVRSGQLVRICRDEHDLPFIEELRENALRGYLERSANFTRTGSKDQNISIPPPMEVVRDLLTLKNWPFPPLQGISETPTIRLDGSILNEPGYDPETELYYAPAPNLHLPDIIESPTQQDAKKAIAIIEEVICDFPFENQSSRANAIGAMMTPILRPLISGTVPMSLFDKPQAGTGASLLADVTSLIATGRTSAMLTAPSEDEDWRKAITSLLNLGRNVVTVDNIEGRLTSASLASVLTSSSWQDRILGRTEMIILPHRITWLGTGNNIRLGGDLPRRCYWVKMDSKEVQPWRRKGFKHEDLPSWVTEHRGEIVMAILIAARSWILAGKPHDQNLPIMGSFDHWVKIVGNILSFSGVKGFLENLNDMYEQADEETPQWESFISIWHDAFGDKSMTVAELTGLMKDKPAVAEAIPPDLADSVNDKGFTRRLGRALARRAGVRYSNNYNIIKGKSEKHAITWSVQKTAITHGEFGEFIPEARETHPYLDTKGELGEFTPSLTCTRKNNNIIKKEEKHIYIGEGINSQNLETHQLTPEEEKSIIDKRFRDIERMGFTAPGGWEEVLSIWRSMGSPEIALKRFTISNLEEELPYTELTDTELAGIGTWLKSNKVEI